MEGPARRERRGRASTRLGYQISPRVDGEQQLFTFLRLFTNVWTYIYMMGRDETVHFARLHLRLRFAFGYGLAWFDLAWFDSLALLLGWSEPSPYGSDLDTSVLDHECFRRQGAKALQASCQNNSR